MGKSTRQFQREAEEQIHNLLCGCTPAARLMWLECRYVMDWMSDRKGYVKNGANPMLTQQLAQRAGCPVGEAGPAIAELESCNLIVVTDGAMHAPLVESIHHAKAQNNSYQKAHRERLLALNKAHRKAGVRPKPPPSPKVSPHTPLPIPHPSPSVLFENGAERCASAFSLRDSAKPKREPKARKRETTPEQQAAKAAFDRWWAEEAFPAQHSGLVYPDYDGADAAAVWKLLRHPKVWWNLEPAKDLALFYLRQPEVYGNVGHRLRTLGQRLGQFVTMFHDEKQKGRRNGYDHKPVAHRGTRENLTL